MCGTTIENPICCIVWRCGDKVGSWLPRRIVAVWWRLIRTTSGQLRTSSGTMPMNTTQLTFSLITTTRALVLMLSGIEVLLLLLPGLWWARRRAVVIPTIVAARTTTICCCICSDRKHIVGFGEILQFEFMIYEFFMNLGECGRSITSRNVISYGLVVFWEATKDVVYLIFMPNFITK